MFCSLILKLPISCYFSHFLNEIATVSVTTLLKYSPPTAIYLMPYKTAVCYKRHNFSCEYKLAQFVRVMSIKVKLYGERMFVKFSFFTRSIKSVLTWSKFLRRGTRNVVNNYKCHQSLKKFKIARTLPKRSDLIWRQYKFGQ